MVLFGLTRVRAANLVTGEDPSPSRRAGTNLETVERSTLGDKGKSKGTQEEEGVKGAQKVRLLCPLHLQALRAAPPLFGLLGWRQGWPCCGHEARSSEWVQEGLVFSVPAGMCRDSMRVNGECGHEKCCRWRWLLLSPVFPPKRIPSAQYLKFSLFQFVAFLELANEFPIDGEFCAQECYTHRRFGKTPAHHVRSFDEHDTSESYTLQNIW